MSEFLTCCLCLGHKTSARIVALLTLLVDLLLSVSPYIDMSLGQRDFQGFYLAFTLTDLAIFGSTSVLLYVATAVGGGNGGGHNKDLVALWLGVHGFRAFVGVVGVIAVCIVCIMNAILPFWVVLLFILLGNLVFAFESEIFKEKKVGSFTYHIAFCK